MPEREPASGRFFWRRLSPRLPLSILKLVATRILLSLLTLLLVSLIIFFVRAGALGLA